MSKETLPDRFASSIAPRAQTSAEVLLKTAEGQVVNVLEWELILKQGDAGEEEVVSIEKRKDEVLKAFDYCLKETEEWVFLYPRKFPEPGTFYRIVQRLFEYDVYVTPSENGQKETDFFFFEDIDCQMFEWLLYSPELLPEKVCLAKKIAVFQTDRKAFYDRVREPQRDKETHSYPESAAYDFKKVTRDVEEVREINGQKVRKTVQVPDSIRFDELVTHLWRQGIRFGIDAEQISEIIKKQEIGRKLIAVAKKGIFGQDACVKSDQDWTKRDMAPMIDDAGKAELTRFRRTVPDVKAETILYYKIPRVLGIPGRDIAGSVIEPPLPKDEDISQYSGPGTQIEERGGKECIVAAQNGILHLDYVEWSTIPHMSVRDEFSMKDDISLWGKNSTGDLILRDKKAKLAGGIWSGRTVDVESLVLAGNSEWNVHTQDDAIIGGQSSFGTTYSERGNIESNQSVSAQIMEAPNGVIRVHGNVSASVLRAKEVIVDGFVGANSYIIADKITLGGIGGSLAWGQSITVEIIGSQKYGDTLLVLDRPDFEWQKKEIIELQEWVDQITSAKKEFLQLVNTFPPDGQAKPLVHLLEMIRLFGKLKTNGRLMTPAEVEKLWKMRQFSEIIQKWARLLRIVLNLEEGSAVPSKIEEFLEKNNEASQQVKEAQEKILADTQKLAEEEAIFGVRIQSAQWEFQLIEISGGSVSKKLVQEAKKRTAFDPFMSKGTIKTPSSGSFQYPESAK